MFLSKSINLVGQINRIARLTSNSQRPQHTKPTYWNAIESKSKNPCGSLILMNKPSFWESISSITVDSVQLPLNVSWIYRIPYTMKDKKQRWINIINYQNHAKSQTLTRIIITDFGYWIICCGNIASHVINAEQFQSGIVNLLFLSIYSLINYFYN